MTGYNPKFLTEKEIELIKDLEHALRIGAITTPEGEEAFLKLKMKDKLRGSNEVVIESFKDHIPDIETSVHCDDKYLLLGLFNRMNDMQMELSNANETIFELVEVVKTLTTAYSDIHSELTMTPQPRIR